MIDATSIHTGWTFAFKKRYFCSMQDFQSLFSRLSSLKVGVVGDVMLDTYMWGKVERVSPEAPVPIVSLQEKEYRIGGAANVALNCRSLGADTTILSVTGNDTEAVILQELLEAEKINTSWLLKSDDRITTNKTRVISRNQQMLRLDNEIISDLDPNDELSLIEKARIFIETEKPDVLIFEDYNKGVLTEMSIREITELCRKEGVITTVDPKRKNFFAYQQVDIFKPNWIEVREALNIISTDTDQSLLQTIHRDLRERLQHQVSFITLSDKGVFYQQDDTTALIPSHLRKIADVSGAGDTVIAVASMVYAATRNIHLMSEIANIAGGLVCEQVGTVAIQRDRLLNECEVLLS